MNSRLLVERAWRAPASLALLCALCAACGVPESPGEASPSSASEEPSVARPATARNLLWISLDTLRADRLGCYGYERDTSPTLDQLAQRGLLFEDASSPAPWTMPAHSSLFTGLYPQRTGVVGFETAMFEDVAHVAELLAERGFGTLAVVSNSALTLHGLERGFQEFQYVERTAGPEPSLVTPIAVRLLQARDRTRPFFALVHYNEVHAPYRSMPRHERKLVRPYEGSITGRNAEFLAHATGRRRFTEADVAYLSDRYDAAIRQLDVQLKQLFEFIEKEHLLKDTLVVITSDHGEEFFDHDEVNHAMTQYQELVRVPLILLGPGIPAGTRDRNPVSLVDLLPTSLGQLGIPSPEGLDGLDLAGLWRDDVQPPARRHLYFQADCAPPDEAGVLVPGFRRAIRDERFKLHLEADSGRLQLFDLAADPREQMDVQAQHPDVSAALLQKLRAFLAEAPEASPAAPLSAEQLRRLEDLGYVQGGD